MKKFVRIQADIAETFDKKFQEIKDNEPPENKIISANEFLAMNEKYSNRAPAQNDEGGDKKLDYIRRLIKEYVTIVKTQVQDYVRKQVKSELVFFASDNIDKAMESQVKCTLMDKSGRYLHGVVKDTWVRLSAGKLRGKVVFVSEEKGEIEVDANDILDLVLEEKKG